MTAPGCVAASRLIPGATYGEEAGKARYAVATMTIENIGNGAQTPDGSEQVVYDAKGRKLPADSGTGLALGDENGSSTWFEENNPGTGVHGKIAFDLPQNTWPTEIELHDSMLSSR